MRSRYPQRLRKPSAHILTSNNQAEFTGAARLRQAGIAAPISALFVAGYPFAYRCLARAIKADFRPRVRLLFAVPELHAINRAPLTRYIEFRCFSARAKPV